MDSKSVNESVFITQKNVSTLPLFHRLYFRFYFESERGLFPNTEFVFDLELPLDYIPENADGEVESFELVSAANCIEKILSSDFKTTSAPIALDFLIRHGVITAEDGE